MPIQDREYFRASHPPSCTCAACTDRRLKRLRKEAHQSYVSSSPGLGKTSGGKGPTNLWGPKAYIRRPQVSNWLKALLLIFALSIAGPGISTSIGSFIPLWLLLGFAVLYSIERWFYYLTRRYKRLGKLYRLLLNLSLLSLLGLLIWSGVRLFSQQFLQSPLAGAIVFLAEFSLFVWMGRVVSRNSWRWPSMKSTVFCLLAVSIVFAFAGVQPLASYKDQTFTFVAGAWHTITAPSESSIPKSVEIPTESTPEAVPEQPVLRNPSWAELKDFLYADDTDRMQYVYPTTVCYHFATTLQKNAQAAGWRCALVTVKLEGYPDWYGYGIPSSTGHALNAFETTDRGLVYIDCTAAPTYSGNADKIVDVRVGGQYSPRGIFSSVYWESMGTVVAIESIRW